MNKEELKSKVKSIIPTILKDIKKVDDSSIEYDEITKFPELKKIIVDLLSLDFNSFLDSIDWVSPKPTTFRINLKNDQSFYLVYNGRSWIAQIEGKKYYLLNLPEEHRAVEAISRILRYGAKEETEPLDEPEETEDVEIDDIEPEEIQETKMKKSKLKKLILEVYKGQGPDDNFDIEPEEIQETKMKKSKLKKLILEVYKGQGPDDNFEEESYSNDGWKEEYFEDLGLLGFTSSVAKLDYEIKNARRGAYALAGDQKSDIISYMEDLKDQIENIIDGMRF